MARKWVACDLEDAYFGDDRKVHRQERKQLKAKDRSKYKKTDREKPFQKSQKELSENLLRGRVLALAPQEIRVESEGKIYLCSLKGLLKKEKTQHKNLVVVGDFVLFEPGSENAGVIAHVEPRRTKLSRADNLSRRKEQLLAANIDLVLITGSVVLPPLKAPLIDRYIIAAKSGGMQPVVVINKIDLLNDAPEEKALFEELKQAYAQANIPFIAISAETGEGLDALKAVMRDKASVFSGQSGVGKTSLINAMTGMDLRIGDTVEKTRKGSHTTTTTQLIPLEFGGFCIDTPGIKSFGVWELKLEDIESYFSEIQEVGKKCKFQDCAHLNEENCAVLKAVEKGKISAVRFLSYQALRASVQEHHFRR